MSVIEATWGAQRSPLQEFAEAVRGVTGRALARAGTGWVTACPAHDDRSPSLSLAEGSEGQVLLHCHAGCDPRDVVAAVGWEMGDLFVPEGKPALTIPKVVPSKTTASEYLYVDEQGEPLFRVVVTRQADGGKEVRQHRAMPGGGWAKTLGQARRVLYRLPEVRAAVAAAAPVFVVEGEKCVEAVESLGLVATTNPGGAGKWLDEFSGSLAGADVVVLPDNDGVGLAHAEQVAGSLGGVAGSVTVVALPGLPEKGDVADWVAAGGSREGLLALVRDARSAGSWDARNVGAPAVEEPVWAAPVLDPAAQHGVFGEVLALLDGCTEAEPAAILAHLLVGFGSLVGPGPYLRIGTQKMPAKTYAVVVGASARARKGTAWSDAAAVLERVDEEFFATQYVTGLSSGEGLISRLRDVDDEDAPQRDPRLLVVEPEWGKILRQNQRQGNTLSAVVREGWDTHPLQVLTRADPLRASRHHIGIVGHITVDELLAELDTTSAANGFANRHLMMHVQRTKVLAEPAEVDESLLGLVALKMRQAAVEAGERREVRLSAAAKKHWQGLYDQMEQAPEPTGIAAHLTTRGSAQVLRLALLYALADRSDAVEVEHLEAGHAVWRYAEASVLHVFGQRLGNPRAERLLRAVRAAGQSGLDGTGAYEALDRNADREEIQTLVGMLTRLGLVEARTLPSGPRGGRPRKVLIARQ